jgi:hypothetical protein
MVNSFKKILKTAYFPKIKLQKLFYPVVVRYF